LNQAHQNSYKRKQKTRRLNKPKLKLQKSHRLNNQDKKVLNKWQVFLLFTNNFSIPHLKLYGNSRLIKPKGFASFALQ
jgi:hypothetical protein